MRRVIRKLKRERTSRSYPRGECRAIEERLGKRTHDVGGGGFLWGFQDGKEKGGGVLQKMESVGKPTH